MIAQEANVMVAEAAKAVEERGGGRKQRGRAGRETAEGEEER